jgi:hypothetical protein
MNTPVPHYWKKVLQGVSHWISYKQQYYAGHMLTEGAIVSEVAQLLNAKLPDSERFQCERMYKDFLVDKTGQTRLDLVIGKKKTPHKDLIAKEDLLVAVEVKRYESDWKLIQSDIEKLYRLKSEHKNARLFLIVFGQGRLPKKLFTDSHFLKSRNLYDGNLGIEAVSRLAKKSYSSKIAKWAGNYAIIVEVDTKA